MSSQRAAEPWGGIYFSTATIPFTDSRKKISARVYSTKVDSVIKFKVEVPGGTSVEVASTPTGAANTWSTVTWDFNAVDLTKAYRVIAITPDADVATSDQSYYFDDITLVGEAGVPVTPGDYLYLKDNALRLSEGTTTTSYSMTQFQSVAGINVKWPMTNAAALKLDLVENGSF